MTPKGTPDPEYPTSNSRKGDRKDRKDLIEQWLKAKPVRNRSSPRVQSAHRITHFLFEAINLNN